MPARWSSISRIAAVLTAAGLFFGAGIAVVGQSQEPKPGSRGTPIAPPEASVAGTPVSGVSDASWEGPNWGIRVAWDPEIWSVEGELIDAGYDGLQIGTPGSTVFIETYTGFDGDADDCLADAEREIGERESVSEVVALSGRQLPETKSDSGVSQLFGTVATLPGGDVFRGTEFVMCQTLVAGEAVLELTWQTTSASYNEELPKVEELFAAIERDADNSGTGPLLPSLPPVADPATASYWPAASPPESASAK